jgi:antitoxin ParD1/3/4
VRQALEFGGVSPLILTAVPTEKILDNFRHPKEGRNMEITLPPEWEQRIADKVAGGEFSNADEVVLEAVRRLFAEEEHLAVLRAKIQEGVESADRGELMDADEFFAELEREMYQATEPQP